VKKWIYQQHNQAEKNISGIPAATLTPRYISGLLSEEGN
jgi:hypothetical protein